MKKKSYKVTFALKEGYSPKGKVHSIAEATKVIKDWMEQRLAAGQPVVGGLLQDGQLFFPAVEGPKGAVTVSPTAVYEGELSSPEEIRRKNREVKDTLESLALRLKKELNKNRSLSFTAIPIGVSNLKNPLWQNYQILPYSPVSYPGNLRVKYWSISK
jgi:hypothetical protein